MPQLSNNQHLLIYFFNSRIFLRHLCLYQQDTLNTNNVEDGETIKALQTETESVKRFEEKNDLIVQDIFKTKL